MTKKIDDDTLTKLFPKSYGAKRNGDYPHAYKQIDADLRNEQPGEKVWSNPRAYGHIFNPNENYKTHMFRKVPLDDLINSIDMSTMNHQDAWKVNGVYDPKLFKYNKFEDNDLNKFMRATRDENNKYTIEDGRHRLLALKNDGYTHVVIPIRQTYNGVSDELKKEYNAMLEDTNPNSLPTYIRWINYQIKKGGYDKESAEKLKEMLRR